MSLSARFGTLRGLVRLLLSYPEAALGLADIRKPDPAAVKRLVFVCHGNICRSAFAEGAARAVGLNAVSFGLSTSSGLPAHPPAADVGKALGVDLASHRTTRVEDYVPQAGDLLLAMETRQLRRIATLPRLASLPRTLLGLYASPPVPHLHDPYELSGPYMETCLRRVADAVNRLGAAFPGAKAS